MSYDQLKETGTSPPVYPYVNPTGPGEAVGYQLTDRVPGHSSTQQYNLPPPPPPDQGDEENETPEKDPSTVSVAHLNVSCSSQQWFPNWNLLF